MALFFGILLFFWLFSVGAYFFFNRWFRSSDADKIKSRLMGTPKKSARPEGSKVALFDAEEQPKGQVIPRLMKKFNLNDKLSTLLDQAGLKWNPVKLVHMCLAGFLLGYAGAYLFLPPKVRPYSMILAAVVGALPLVYVIRLRAIRLKAFEEVFPDTLEFISRSMRAGHAFSVSLEMIHREFPEPLSGEFRRTFEEHNLGLPLDVALQGLGESYPSAGRAFLCVGGSAAETYRRQPRRDSRQVGLRDPRALQTARPYQGDQRSRQDDGHRSDVYPDRRRRSHVLRQSRLREVLL